MKIVGFLFIIISITGNAQSWEVKNHPNNGKMAIFNNSKQISSYRFSEVGELSQGKAFVAEGDLYGYINENGKLETSYQFVIATNFKDGYAIVGDSINQNILNTAMKLLLPSQFARVKLPYNGLILVQSHEGLWGTYDTSGSELIPPMYALPPRILNKNKIIVRLNDEYGVVNAHNESIFNASYQYISPTGYGYKSGKYLRLF